MAVALRGNLRDFGIGEVFQLIGQQRKTGILEVEGTTEKLRMGFLEGAVVWAAPVGPHEHAALGDMLELGDTSERAHREAGARAAELGVDRLYLLGTEVSALEAGALEAGMPASRVRTYESKTALVETLRKELDEPAVLLVKGSRGMRMEEVVELLTAEAPASRSAEA